MAINYTFVIPHYDIPLLLNRCLDSIPQRDDIQIIVVDDGSEKKPQIVRDDVELIMLPKHTNAGNARNVGLKQAKGKWVLFPDADDFYNPGFIDTLDRYADSDIQILYFSVNSRKSETLETSDRRCKAIIKYVNAAANGDQESRNNILYRCSSAWFKMFSKQFLDNWHIQFEAIPKCNDVLFSLNANFHVTRYAIIKEQLYCITYREGSLSYSQRSLAQYLAIISTAIKRRYFFDAIGRKEFTSPLINLFLGFDNPLRRRNRAEELCNCLVYAVKVLFVLTLKFKSIYKGRMEYVNVVKGNQND